MTMPDAKPFSFASMACSMAGFGVPEGEPSGVESGFRMRFEVVSGADLSLAYDAEGGAFLITASFEPPKRRALEEVLTLALTSNHLRREDDLCFAIDPASQALTASRQLREGAVDVADLAIAMTELTAFATAWRAMMDEPPAAPLPMGADGVIRA